MRAVNSTARFFVLNQQEEITGDHFRGFFHATGNPPFDGLHKGGYDVVLPKFIGNLVSLGGIKHGKVTVHKGFQIYPEVPQKQFVVPTGKQGENMVVVVLNMLQQVQKHRCCAATIKNMPVFVFIFFSIKYMAEQFLTKGFQQKILGFKMGIEGGAANIRSFYDFSHRDLAVIFFGKQLGKRVKNRFPGFSLPSVHIEFSIHFW